jgi:hypothetical protein
MFLIRDDYAGSCGRLAMLLFNRIVEIQTERRIERNDS